MAKKAEVAKGKVKSREKVVQKPLLGRRTRYIGVGGMKFKCPGCERTMKRGMCSIYRDIFYCSEHCIRKVNDGLDG